MGLEPAEPLGEPRHPAGGEGGRGGVHHQAGGPVGVAGGHRVADRRLGELVVLAPLGRPPGQLGGQGGLAALQLGPEQLPQQPVEPVPLPAPVQGEHQQVGPRQGLEQVARPAGGEHGVAQRSGHTLQHRAPGQERDQARGEPGQQLELQVAGHEPVVRGRGGRLGGPPAAGPQGLGGEVQGDRPALGPPQELLQVDPAEVDRPVLQERAGLGRVHGQVPGADLHHPPLGAQAGQRERRLAPAGDRQLRSPREVLDQAGHGVQAGPVLQQVDVVEHEHGRLPGRGQRRPEPGKDGVDRRARVVLQLQRAPVGRRDLVAGGDEVPQQDRGVVVTPVDGQPCERPLVALGPLRQQRRLPVAGWGDDRRHRHPAGSVQEVEQGRPADLGPGPELWPELGLKGQGRLAGHAASSERSPALARVEAAEKTRALPTTGAIATRAPSILAMESLVWPAARSWAR